MYSQMMLNCSMGVIATNSGGLIPKWVSADTAGSDTISQRSFVKNMLAKNATTKPAKAFNNRERSSSKCSMNDMRSMPSSSSSPSSSAGGGGGGGGGVPTVTGAGVTS